ncbi:chromosome segregation protein SMC [Jeotgalibaca caeni]|uniref:chromosome segregation protein SMC n=1 Tax=Jeotgalibaca caeni TaxID=3028623 RepID=UPI00237D92AE|nr:chromosome segregation protein SMC [Jeotgalibaca caeni]MDE1548034.1 chromosome segregation protein SMC [Jeotgalibaca caeni]
MHLERIEITGFKSFADKTIIEFDKGVTAIVGPNGSGKSNISEAVRWVLGEQSARNLRGKKMNDIVFSGSQTRKQVNIAEVTIVLNNEDHSLPLDFTEISLTRRLNRNGDSDCFINKKPCRLKDITDLLMDSGIGKDSFSMISQGKVEQIFQNKPEDRRAIFEDAAGVAKYKNRKTSAERKLADTEEHLNRVEDILHEIKNQLIPLEKQRNTAVRYQEMKQQLSEIEIALMVVEIEALNEQWQLNKVEMTHYKEQAAQMESKQKVGQDTLTQLKAASLENESELAALQEEYIAIIRKIEQLEGQKNILEQKADFSAKNKEEQQKMLEQKKLLIERATKQRHTLSESRKQKYAIRKELQEKIAELQENVTKLSQDKNDWIQELRDTYIEKLQLQSTNKNTLHHLEKDQAQLMESLTSLRKKINEMTRLLEASKAAFSKEEEQVTSLQAAIQAHESEFEQVRTNVAGNQEVLETDNQKLLQLSKAIQQAEARRESLVELEESYASYYQGVKEILKRRETIRGIHGPIGELFQVPETYTLAIDTALGSAIQHIVVTDTEAASNAIAILKRNHLGRATFLPLSVIKGRSVPSYLVHDLMEIPGFIGIGSDLITYESDYTAIAANLLGTTIIAEDLQSGLALARRSENRYRVVSLEGDIIHAGGSMTGGATKKQQGSSVFSRKNSIEKLSAFLDDKTALYQKLDANYKTIQQQVHEQQTRKEQLQTELSKFRFELERHEESKEREEQQVKRLEEELVASEYEWRILEKNRVEMTEELASEQKLKGELAEEIQALKKNMDDSTLSEEERQKRLQLIQQELQQKQQEAAIIQEQEKQLRRDIQQLSEAIETETQTVTAIQDSLLQASVMESSEYQSIDEVNERLVIDQASRTDLDGKIKAKRTAKKELDEKISTEEATLQSIRSTIKIAWEELAKLESSSSRYEVAIDHHLNRLSEEYGLSYEAAKGTYQLSLQVGEAAARVKQLKQDIQALGPINLTAIEEYDRILERYEFLSKQQLDLVTAKDILLHTMSEMDQEVSLRFEQMFKQIKQQFEITFPRLFGGGKATIELTDPTNLLETGIEIIAQPPGKKLQQLSLLSGGEKAFTAIALLFSIIEVSPVPFCILDEVEAALDEANVVRFGRYLASFEKQTQFIVITHRKGTMEEADVLYGVTMQDSGVSRLASIRFEDQDVVLEGK